MDEYSEVFLQFGVSGLLGVCSGLAIKRISQGVAITVGVIFTGLQFLSHMGYISIDFEKIQNDLGQLMDVTGDESFDAADIKILWNKAIDVLMHKLPNATAFYSGLAIGLYIA